MNSTTKAVIFDLDGTLIDSLPDVLGALNPVLINNGRRPITTEEGKLMVGGGVEPLIQRAFALTGEPAAPAEITHYVNAFTDNYRKAPAKYTTVFDGVINAAEELVAKGYALGICTNKPHQSAQAVLRAVNLDRHFTACVGKDVHPFNKPDRRHYDVVARKLGASAENTVYVGDSETDVETARNAGVPIILVPFGYSHRPAAELGGDRLIRHFSELPDAIEDLFSIMSAT